MPITNTRNGGARTMQSTDFVQKQDSFTAQVNLTTLARTAPGLIDSWIMSPIAKDAGTYVYYPGLVQPMYWTSTVNACVALTNPGANIYRHGLMGAANLGEVTQKGLWTAVSNAHDQRTYAEGWSATQGLWAMTGLYYLPTATIPAATGKTIFAKFRDDSNGANYQFSWTIEIIGSVVECILSETGNSTAVFTSALTVAPGKFYIIGFVLNTGTSVTIFVNNQYQTFVLPSAVYAGHPNRIPIALYTAPDTPVTIARRQTVTAGYSSFPSANAYYYFSMYGHAALTISQWLSKYYAIKPALGWNTNLGGV